MPTVGAQGDTSPPDQAMNIAASTVGQSAASGGPRPPQNPGARALRWYAAPLLSPKTYFALVYLALSFPIGLATFVGLAVATSVSAGLVVTVVGIPLLVATMYAWCSVASFEAQLSNALLGTRIPAPFDPLPAKPWQWDAIRARVSSAMTWRAFLFLLLRLPQGVGALVLVSISLSMLFFFLTAPLFAEMPFPTEAFGDAEEPLRDGLYIFGHHYDAWYEALHFLPVGLVLLPLAAHAIVLGGRLSGLMATGLLGRGRQGAMNPPGRSEVQAALAWEGVYKGKAIVAHEPRAIAIRAAALAIHFGLTAVVLLFLLMLNGMYSPETWWVLWVAWALLMPFALHFGYFIAGHVGAHVGLFIVVATGFYVIDMVLTPGHIWFFWPLLPWLPVLLLHAWISPRFKFFQPGEGPAPTTPPTRTPDAPNSGTVATFTMTDLASTSSAGNEQATVTLAEPPANIGFIQPLRLSFVETVRDEPVARVATGLLVDAEFRHASIDGAQVDLTPKEFELLSLLVANPGKPFSREQLLDRIWTNEYEVTDRTIDTHVLRLRKKLGSYGPAVQTVWGFGYKYQPGAVEGVETPDEAPAIPSEKTNTGW